MPYKDTSERNKRMNKREKKKLKKFILTLLLAIVIALIGYFSSELDISFVTETPVNSGDTQVISFNLDEIPEFDGETPYVTINNNIPEFEEKDLVAKSFEKYSDLDSLKRCGVAYACVGVETMPTESRQAINKIKPSGWQNAKYDFVDGKYLYNRCHLIGFQLTAENANEKNLITGTRFMNVQGMLPFENQVAEYVKKNKKHVLYRVTPIFKEQNLVASGVQMEAESVEDKGKSVLFNVYVYNNQPGVAIDYLTGTSSLFE